YRCLDRRSRASFAEERGDLRDEARRSTAGASMMPRSTKTPARKGIEYGLWVVIVIAAAMLVSLFTAPLLSRSFSTFLVVAGVCWAVIFAGAVAMTRRLGRADSSQDEDAPSGGTHPAVAGPEPQ